MDVAFLLVREVRPLVPSPKHPSLHSLQVSKEMQEYRMHTVCDARYKLSKEDTATAAPSSHLFVAAALQRFFLVT